MSNALNLQDKVPDNILFVAESGVSSVNDIKTLKDSDVNAVLMGKSL